MSVLLPSVYQMTEDDFSSADDSEETEEDKQPVRSLDFSSVMHSAQREVSPVRAVKVAPSDALRYIQDFSDHIANRLPDQYRELDKVHADLSAAAALDPKLQKHVDRQYRLLLVQTVHAIYTLESLSHEIAVLATLPNTLRRRRQYKRHYKAAVAAIVPVSRSFTPWTLNPVWLFPVPMFVVGLATHWLLSLV